MDLVLNDVTVARGGLPVLEGISFRLSEGQAIVLRGPNGAGKTTLLRTVAGLQPPMAGSVEGAEDRVAYAAHADGIKQVLTVSENLRLWAAVFGVASIEAALVAFNLVELADRPAGSLSAGQKRRLGLARLMVTGRPIWVLDEPTVSLDVASVTLFADAVRAHLASGGMALMATHIDLGLEAQVFDVTGYKATLPAVDDFDGGFL
ncbi:MAG: heme ABC exporter ATP-binding protein CcmA [Pseudomonadota bacterium]|nr:heme ABC exporter ATP-binding protein CcmA [Pseudomonadota bacterium]